MVWSPTETSIADGVLPTKLPSTSISAPSGVEAMLNLLPMLAFTSFGCVGVDDGAVAVSDATVVLCVAQCLEMLLQASSTEPPRDNVDLLMTESPLAASKTATLFLCASQPLPPSWSRTTM